MEKRGLRNFVIFGLLFLFGCFVKGSVPVFTIVDFCLKDKAHISKITFSKKVSSSSCEERFLVEDKNAFLTIWALGIIAKALAENEFLPLQNRNNELLNKFSEEYLSRKLPGGFKKLLEMVREKIRSNVFFSYFVARSEIVALLEKSNGTWKDFFENLGKFLEKHKFNIDYNGKVVCKHYCELFIFKKNGKDCSEFGKVNLYGFGFLDFKFSVLISDIHNGTVFIAESLQNLGMKNILDVDCPICMEKISKASVTSCSHVFCFECLKGWLKKEKTCPMCRKDISKENFSTPDFSTSDVDVKIQEKCFLCAKVIVDKFTTHCGHDFCNNCLYFWSKISSDCPVCKINFWGWLPLGKKE